MDIVENQESLSKVNEHLDNLVVDISFSAVTSVDQDVNENPAIFDIVRQNKGQGYDSHSGTFSYWVVRRRRGQTPKKFIGSRLLSYQRLSYNKNMVLGSYFYFLRILSMYEAKK